MDRANTLFAKFGYKLIRKAPPAKQEAELNFWRRTLGQIEKWYLGEIQELYGEPSPCNDQKVTVQNIKDSAVLTWGKIHQQAKYLQDLGLSEDAFAGMKLLDIGSGPFPSALAFKDCEIYCLDPLLPGFVAAGFPLHYYERVQFVSAPSEEIPCPDHYFDAIISVNAIDHVDDFERTTREIRRVLAPSGKLRFHVHYHTSTPLEPIELNDQVMMQSFAWCRDFRKIKESREKRGHVLSTGDGMYTIWSNF